MNYTKEQMLLLSAQVNDPNSPNRLSLKECREVIADWLEMHSEVDGLRCFKRGVDEALNSGDGSYRP